MSAFRLPLIVLALLGSLAAGPVRAAEDYDNCTGFITSLPASITTQGVWCLDRNLNTAISSGTAIFIATNNVTLDCNDFKVGGLAAGAASTANGIAASSRQNITIRNCNVRGFEDGISLDGGGHVVEDNRLDSNLRRGIQVFDVDGKSVVRRNLVSDTGGQTGGAIAIGIFAVGDVIDNTVAGVHAEAPSTTVYGIQLNGGALGFEIRGNTVRGVVANSDPDGLEGLAVGIDLIGVGHTLAGNRLLDESWIVTAVPSIGIDSSSSNFCIDNTISGFEDAMSMCSDVGGNIF